MAYVFALQVTLALGLNAWLPPDLAFAFGEICHAQTINGLSDQQDEAPGVPAKAAAHCPLCLTPGLAIIPAPDAPAVTLRSVLGIAFEVAESERIPPADVHSPHLARGPPANA